MFVIFLGSQITDTGHTFGKSSRICVANAVLASRSPLQGQSIVMNAGPTRGQSFKSQVTDVLVSPLSSSPGVQLQVLFSSLDSVSPGHRGYSPSPETMLKMLTLP